MRKEGFERGGNHAFVGQHVAGDADAWGRDAAAPFHAVPSGVGGGAAVAIDDVNLAKALPSVASERGRQSGLG